MQLRKTNYGFLAGQDLFFLFFWIMSPSLPAMSDVLLLSFVWHQELNNTWETWVKWVKDLSVLEPLWMQNKEKERRWYSETKNLASQTSQETKFLKPTAFLGIHGLSMSSLAEPTRETNVVLTSSLVVLINFQSFMPKLQKPIDACREVKTHNFVGSDRPPPHAINTLHGKPCLAREFFWPK